MNKLIKLIALLIFTASFGIKAQDAGVAQGTPMAAYPMLKNKLKKSEKDLENEKKTVAAKYWLSRADLMMDIFEVNLQHLNKGLPQNTMVFYFGNAKEVKKFEKDGIMYETHVHDAVNITYTNGIIDSYEETEKIYENALAEAYKAVQKAEELDVDKKSLKKTVAAYERLKPLFEREGLEYYLAEDFKKSFLSFESAVEINRKEIVDVPVDTSIIYNTGMIASKAEMPEKSIEYYEIARSYNYPEPALYVFLKTKYWELGDTAKGIQSLEQGFEQFPDNSDIIIELINYYLIEDRADEALEYIKIAQKKDPENISLIFAEATLYDKKGDFEKAIEIYEKTIQVNPDYFNGYFNVGVVYFNQAQSLYESAADIRDNDEYNAQIEKADAYLLKAVQPMEKCHELKPDDMSVLDVLKTAYYRLRNDDPAYMEKYNEVKALLEE